MPQCQLTVLGPWSDLVSYNISPCTGSTTSGFWGVVCDQRSGKSRAGGLGCGWFTPQCSHLTGACDAHLRALRFSNLNPHPTSIPPHHAHAHAHAQTHTHTNTHTRARAHKTFPNGSRRPAVNLNCPMPASASRLLLPNPNSTPLPLLPSCRQERRRHRRLTAHIFLSSLALRLDTGQVRPGQDKARECGTRQPCLA